MRRNTSTSLLNSIITGWEKGLSIEGDAVVNNVNGDSLVFVSNITTNFATPSWSTSNTNTVYNANTALPSNAAFYGSFWNADGNDSTSTLGQVNWVNIFTALGTTPDARLNTGSVAGSGANFTHPKFYNLAAPTATTSYTYCVGAAASALTANAGTGNSLYWYMQATGGTSSTTAITPTTSASGTYSYYVSQYNTNGDESPRTAITVVVNANPTAPTINANGPTTFCTGGSVVLTSSEAAGNTWSNSATGSSITVNSSGSYSVTYTNSNGCSATSAPVTVNVSNAPIPTISAPQTEACSGETITLTSSTADSYLWSTGETTQAISVTQGDVYTVTTTNADACAGVGTSDPVTITFGTTPTATGSFTSSGNVVTFTNASSNATSYSWDFGDATNSSAANPTHAYAANGSYTVILTAINGNCSDEATLTVLINVSLEELSGLNQVELYPNPAGEKVNLTFVSSTAQEANLILTNQFGQVVLKNEVTLLDGNNHLEISSGSFANGIYFINLETASGKLTRKLIIKN
ncbi:MAG: PKD domain-containing protein [Cryomorphaceae bacterium]|nr:PKD domain-containing protein [Cryomorphaceae bacterium]